MKLQVTSMNCTLNFEQIERDLFRVTVLVSCCVANQYRETTDLSFTFQTKKRIQRVNKGKINRESASNGDFFEIEDNHESSKDGKSRF